MVQADRIEQYAMDDGIIIADYNLKPHTVKFTTHWQPGFVGKCTYHLRGPDEETIDEAPLRCGSKFCLWLNWRSIVGLGIRRLWGWGGRGLFRSDDSD